MRSSKLLQSLSSPARLNGPLNPSRARANRPLPNARPPLLLSIGAGAGLVSVWGLFVLFATNEERLASSVLRQTMDAVSTDSNVIATLGNGVKLEPAWYMFNAPRIAGQINLLQGIVDMRFRVHGPQGAGLVHFSSVRRAKGEAFDILRFKVILDNGEVLHLSPGNTVQ